MNELGIERATRARGLRRFAAAARSHPAARGIAAGALATAAAVEALIRAGVTGAGTQLTLAVALIALATTLPLAFLRPTPAAVAVTVASVLSLVLFKTLTVAGLLAEVAALYRLGSMGAQGRNAQLLASILGGPFLVLAIIGARPPASEAGVLTIMAAALAPAAGWAGFARRARHEATTQSAAREVIAGTLLEHTARGERARIARELHDVVAHHISMVAVQAETARLTTPGMPPAGAQRLSAIGDTARSALTEMRRLLGVLREDVPGDGPERRPQPGLRQLNDLLDEAREASGTGVRLILQGSPVSLDPGVELAAYRIAQEALTNARRHAPGAAVDVELTFNDDALRLRIRDNGPGPLAETAPGGLGLAGMRERAAAVGGRCRAGAAAGGGFLVEASLPVPPEGLR